MNSEESDKYIMDDMSVIVHLISLFEAAHMHSHGEVMRRWTA